MKKDFNNEPTPKIDPATGTVKGSKEYWDVYNPKKIDSDVLNKYSNMPTTPEAIGEVFSKLDSSMKETLLELAKYKSGLPISQELLTELSMQYEACQEFSEWARSQGVDEPYIFKQTDIGIVKSILLENGYLNEPKKR